MNSPVVVFVYNRPLHTQRTLAALRSASNAANTSLIIFSDAAADARQQTAVDEVRRLCHSVQGFASVEVVERAENYGLARNISEGVSQVFCNYPTAIVLEDDLVVGAGFIDYMNAALEFYCDRNVFSISGYTPEIRISDSYPSSTYLMHRNCSWGWATWRDRWQSVDWQVADFDAFIRNSHLRREFNRCGTDLSPMLLRWRMGEIHSWSIRFCYAAFRQGKPTVYPTASLVQNAGADGTGTNMRSSARYDTQLVQNVDLSRFATDLTPDEQIVREFRKKYNTSVIRLIINTLKRWHYILIGHKE